MVMVTSCWLLVWLFVSKHPWLHSKTEWVLLLLAGAVLLLLLLLSLPSPGNSASTSTCSWPKDWADLGGRGGAWGFTSEDLLLESWGIEPPPSWEDGLSSGPGGRQGCLKASACPVRSMKESMEDRWEPREGLARRGCSKGPPGLVNTLKCSEVPLLAHEVGVGYRWLAHLGVSASSQSLPRLSLCSRRGVSSL